MDNRLIFDTVEEWSRWLNENSENESLVWLRIKKTKSQKNGILVADAVTEALRYGWIDGRLNTIDSDYFWLRFTPRNPKSVWSLINRKRMEKMIEEGSLSKRGYQTIEWAKQYGTWDASYTSFKDTKIPDSFIKMLDSHDKASKKYNLLTNADKLKLLYWLNTAQSSEQSNNRLSRILKWLESDYPINKLKIK